MYKVLVCDDEKDIVSAISIYLTSDGYEVIPARNGMLLYNYKLSDMYEFNKDIVDSDDSTEKTEK